MNKKQSKVAKEALRKAVTLAGSQIKFAQLCGAHLKQGHVYYWLNRSRYGLPAEYVLNVEKALKGAVTRYDLRPDIFLSE